MSKHDHDADPVLRAAIVQRRFLMMSIAALAAGGLVVLGLIWNVYATRAASRKAVQQLACFSITYTPDSNEIAAQIRQHYMCPPVKPLPPRSSPSSTEQPGATVGPVTTQPAGK